MTHDKRLAFIGLGGNLGQPRKAFVRACALLQQRVGALSARSSLYTTAALLDPESAVAQPDYLNAVISVSTLLSPRQILDICCDIEAELGRARSSIESWAPRTIDLDLLAIDDLVISEPGLILPHSQLHLRDFVLEPLCEIAPSWQHPILHKTTWELVKDNKAGAASHIRSKEPFLEFSPLT